LIAQRDMVVNFTVERDKKPPIERCLRLHAIGRIHNAQPARAHCHGVANRHERIGYVAPMQQTRDQTPDRRLGAVPINGDRDTAHPARPRASIEIRGVGQGRPKPREFECDRSSFTLMVG
jgi:hypothetical protein